MYQVDQVEDNEISRNGMRESVICCDWCLNPSLHSYRFGSKVLDSAGTGPNAILRRGPTRVEQH